MFNFLALFDIRVFGRLYNHIVASDWPRTFFTPKVFLFSIVLTGNGVYFTDIVQNVTFEIGETIQSVSVPITRDSIIEAAEEFNLVLKRVPGDDTNITILEPSVSVGIITDTSEFIIAHLLYP